MKVYLHTLTETLLSRCHCSRTPLRSCSSFSSNIMANAKNPRDSDVENEENEAPPPGWVRCFSNSAQREYFVHVATDHAQWEYPSQTEVDDPILAKKRRDDAEAEKQRADAAARKKEELAKKQEEILQLSYQNAIQRSNEEAIQSANPSRGYQSVDDTYIKIYAGGLRGLDNDTIIRLFKTYGKAFIEGRVGGEGAAVLVMERDSGEKAIRHLHNRKTKEGLLLTVKKAFNQNLTHEMKMHLLEDNRTKRRKLSVAFEDGK